MQKNGNPELQQLRKMLQKKWAAMSPHETPANQCRRMGAVKELSKYLVSKEIPSYIYPKQKSVPSNFKPYIFTDEELAEFFLACDNTKSPNLVRKDVVSLIFRMIYSCGLRASEALNLTVRMLILFRELFSSKILNLEKNGYFQFMTIFSDA